MPDKRKRTRSDPELTDLMKRADTIKRVSDDLIRQMKALAEQVQAAKERAARKPGTRG